MILSLHLPSKLIKPNQDRILIIEDIIRSGETQKALCNLVTKAKALIVGVYTLIGIGEEKWKNKLKKMILLNYLEFCKIKNQDQDQFVAAFNNEDSGALEKLMQKKEIPEDVCELIKKLMSNELIDVLINIPEP